MDAAEPCKNVCVFWTKSERHYRESLGLREQAELHHRLGFTHTVHALCAEGYDLILDDIEYLRSFGYLVHDCSRLFSLLKAEFPVLAKTKSEFHFYNLLRWLLIDRVFAKEPVLCFDADLVLNAPASSIIADNSGQTFMVGSTCFVHISDDGWFRGYEETLRRFERDSDSFLDDWKRKENIPFLNIDSKDAIDEERFVRFCVEHQFVPNVWPSNHSGFLYVPFLTRLDGYTMPFRRDWIWPVEYTQVARQHCFNGIPLAFVHYQKDFSYMLGNWLVQHNFLQVEKPLVSIPPDIRSDSIQYCGSRQHLPSVTQLMDGIIRMGPDNENIRRCMSRSFQINYFSDTGFDEIFVDEYWLRAQTFVSRPSSDFTYQGSADL
jgi:hypothetical protein